ncbi:hypothetical protein [Ancylobacter moscoviensis]
MIWFVRLLVLAGGVTLTGGAAAALAALLADAGLLGTCFEGACAYAAIFVAFPLLWLGLFAAFVTGWIWYARRRPRP